MKDFVTWKIAGEAGFGIMSSGVMLAKTFTRLGYHIFCVNDYPSLIRGGHNVVTVRIGATPFMGMTRDLDILVALNIDAVSKNIPELTAGSMILYDPKDKEWQSSDFPVDIILVPLPLKDIIASQSADIIMRNTVALGATVALLGANFESLHSVIEDQFHRKGAEIVSQNSAIAKAGFDYVKEHYPDKNDLHLSRGTYTEKLAVVNGSEALGLGAVRAGLKFAAIYPMTPINSLITFLADHAKSLQLVYKQPEDEISGINMAIGASIAGVRSMVATSGGGFALQVEGLSLAGMVEAPLVIDMGMRVGPATGMPTYTEQGELLFVIHAGHGEFPRIVLAPGDAREAFELTIHAFELADKYQIPVFVLTDKYLNESNWCIPLSVLHHPFEINRGKFVTGDSGMEEGKFLRYDTSTPDGVSVRSVPGTKNGKYYANGYEHDGIGHMTDTAAGREEMVQKRLKKLKAIESEVPGPQTTGDEDADVTFITWGSTKGPVISAMNSMRATGAKVSVLYFNWMFPFPKQIVTDVLSKLKRVIIVEQNATNQLGQLIRQQTGFEVKEKLLKYNGRPFIPEEIYEFVNT